DGLRFLEVSLDLGAPQHRLEGLPALPLRIVHDPGAVEAAVEVGGDEARLLPDDLLGRPGQSLHQARLVLRGDGEDVDQGEDGRSGTDRARRQGLGAWFHAGLLSSWLTIS